MLCNSSLSTLLLFLLLTTFTSNIKTVSCRLLNSKGPSINSFMKSNSTIETNPDHNSTKANIESIHVKSESIWRKLVPSRITEMMFKRFFSIFFNDPDILKTFAKACSWILWLFVVLSFLGTVGVDTKPLISLLGISGLTIGFACKDILQNTFAGIFILFTRPFKRGWIISVCGYRGRVISTDIRYLRLEILKDRSEVLIPLSLVYQNPIIVEQKNI